MASIDKIIKSKNQPKQTNVAWVDLSGETPVTKHFINGKWQVAESNELTPEQIAYIISQVDISSKADKEVTPTVITLSDRSIGQLTTEELENLRIGDIIVTSDGNSKFHHVVTKHTDVWIEIFDFENDKIIRTVYAKIGSSWQQTTSTVIEYSKVAKKILATSVIPNTGMLPNVVYNFGVLSANTTFTLAATTDNTIANVWMWTFETGDTVPTLVFPNVIWTDASKTEEVDGVTMPVIEVNKYYEVTIMNGYGTIMSATIPEVEESEGE